MQGISDSNVNFSNPWLEKNIINFNIFTSFFSPYKHPLDPVHFHNCMTFCRQFFFLNYEDTRTAIVLIIEFEHAGKYIIKSDNKTFIFLSTCFKMLLVRRKSTITYSLRWAPWYIPTHSLEIASAGDCLLPFCQLWCVVLFLCNYWTLFGHGGIWN